MTNIVMCFDGTGGDIRADNNTNVVQLFRRLKSQRDDQLTYYDPGVGTFSAAGAWTPVAQKVSRLLGLAFGAGMRTNLEEAYTFLINHWTPGDDLFIFGFSRGAYCARALVGMLNLVGISRAGSDNLVRYAVSNYARRKPKWSRDDFAQAKQFASITGQKVDGHHWVPVKYLGIWDTVKAPGLLRRSMEWPYTRQLPNVIAGRHAVSIDEKRRPYREYLIDGAQTSIEEVWFAGVHSDIGGGYNEKHCLNNITLNWITSGAIAAGLQIAPDLPFARVTRDNANGTIHELRGLWWMLGKRQRPIPPGAKIHASVQVRVDGSPEYDQGRLPHDSWVDLDWESTDRPAG